MTVGACDFLDHWHRECWTTDANEMATESVRHAPVMVEPVVGAWNVEGDDANVERAPSHELTVERP